MLFKRNNSYPMGGARNVFPHAQPGVQKPATLMPQMGNVANQPMRRVTGQPMLPPEEEDVSFNPMSNPQFGGRRVSLFNRRM